MNKILIGLLTVSLAGNAYFLLKPKDVVIKELAPEKVIFKEVEAEPEMVMVEDIALEKAYKNSSDELESVKAELARVKSELDLLNERIALTKLDEELKVPSIELDENGHPKKEVIDKFSEKKDSIKDLYEKETVDDQWAYATQDKIHQSLNEHGDTSLYEIKQLKCKTSVCKVSLNPYNRSTGSGMAVGMNAMMSLSKNKEMSGYITSFNFKDIDKDRNNQVELYIAKPVKAD